MKPKILLLSLLLLCCFSCSEKKTLPGFDSQAWKNDPRACKAVRLQLLPELQKVRLQLIGLKERELVGILGRPDAEQLFERSQKYYFYYIEPGSQCEVKNQLSDANRLKVRFNSLNYVSEATFEYPIPEPKK